MANVTLPILRSVHNYISICCLSITSRVMLMQFIQIWILSCIGLMKIFKINSLWPIYNTVCNSLLQTSICRDMYPCNPFCRSMYPIVIKYGFSARSVSCFISLWIRSWLQVAAFSVWLLKWNIEWRHLVSKITYIAQLRNSLYLFS